MTCKVRPAAPERVIFIPTLTEYHRVAEKTIIILMLQEIFTNRRSQVRKAAITQKFDRLPEGVVKELDEMLKDGRISREEYEGFVGTISKTKSLSVGEKRELQRMISEWEVEDKSSMEEESLDEKVKPEKTETHKEPSKDLDSQKKEELDEE